MIKDYLNRLKEKNEEKKNKFLKKKMVDERNKELFKMSREEQIKDSACCGDILFCLKYIKDLKSYGTEYAEYYFYETMDIDEKEATEPFEGLMIKLNPPGEGKVYVSYEELLEIIMRNKDMYIVFNPDKKEIVEQYIEEFKKKVNLK